MAVRNRATKRFDLVVFGEFFSDLIFDGLSHEPRLGEEVKTRSFLIAPGGGLATSAIAASRLGSRTAVITRVGADANTLSTWAEILHDGLDVSACEVRRGKPTALTVSAAFRANRMLLTHDPITNILRTFSASGWLSTPFTVHDTCTWRAPCVGPRFGFRCWNVFEKLASPFRRTSAGTLTFLRGNCCRL